MLQTDNPIRTADSLLPDLIAYAELPTRLGMSRWQLDRIAKNVAERFPPRRRVGRRLFVSETALRRWLANRFDATPS